MFFVLLFETQQSKNTKNRQRAKLIYNFTQNSIKLGWTKALAHYGTENTLCYFNLTIFTQGKTRLSNFSLQCHTAL